MPNPPRATYRVQLHAGFGFDDARAIVPYLADLGVSHLYTSPVLQAMPGSTHGYDVVDHGRVSAELGGEAGFLRLSDTLRQHGMGLVLDIVPNHMAIGEQNRWWWDVLEHGPASRYAGYFDVDWDPPERRLQNVILLPVLPDHYGRVLEAGEIRLARRDSHPVVEHGDRAFPLDPQTAGELIIDAAARAHSEKLGLVGRSLADLPPSTAADPELVARRERESAAAGGELAELLADPALSTALDAAIEACNRDVDALDALLGRQNYRLALWRAASRDLGYRRFFDIDGLIGLRMEDERVFADTHALPLRWIAEGRVDGLRIDHPDGLRDPAGYFTRLREAAPDAWIVAEKILEADESLPADWPIDGTTGYRFANLATGILVDPDAEAEMTAIWNEVADAGPEWETIVEGARAEVLSTTLGSDVNRLTELFLAVCEANRRYRDFTRHELHHALREVAASLPVYRTYVRAADRHLTEVDADLVTAAVARAAARRPDLDPELFDVLGRILRLELDGPLADELAMRFQQLSPAAMAKGVEDTSFYRHHRLVALNEVGGNPGHFGVEPGDLHGALSALARDWPAAMLALSTHDTKRSADLRARLAIVTEDPANWRRATERWLEASAEHRTGPELPTDADAYLLLQVLVGAWPIDADRAAAYMEKASREAKLRTSWTAPDAAYDEALARFVRDSLADESVTAVIKEIVGPVIDAGRRAALAQAALHLTAPGVPDLYQGTELWDHSLVDPDNRRPVDYDRRRRLLAEAGEMSAADAWARRDEGLPKLWLTTRLLELRSCEEALRAGASFEPLAASGPRSDALVAFVRGERVVSVIPRLVHTSEHADWSGTSLTLPGGTWTSLDGTDHAGSLGVDELLAAFPVAVLERRS